MLPLAFTRNFPPSPNNTLDSFLSPRRWTHCGFILCFLPGCGRIRHYSQNQYFAHPILSVYFYYLLCGLHFGTSCAEYALYQMSFLLNVISCIHCHFPPHYPVPSGPAPPPPGRGRHRTAAVPPRRATGRRAPVRGWQRRCSLVNCTLF